MAPALEQIAGTGKIRVLIEWRHSSMFITNFIIPFTSAGLVSVLCPGAVVVERQQEIL